MPFSIYTNMLILSVGQNGTDKRKVYILGILSILSMETKNIFGSRSNEEITSMKVSIGFLRLIEKFRNKRESYEQTITRLLLSKDVNIEESKIIKEAQKDYMSQL